MSPRTKSVLLLLATLIIGLLLGAIANGYFVRERLDRLGNLMTPGGFGGRVEEVLQPTSEEQRRAIREVLDAAAPRAVEIMRRSREDMRALNDSVKEQLADVLSEEQMARLEEHLRFRRRGPWRGRPPMLEGRPPGPRRMRGRRLQADSTWGGDTLRPPPPPPPVE